MTEKATRFTIEQSTKCDHCRTVRHKGERMFRTSKGVYCSTTCKMWHEGQLSRPNA